MGPESLQRTSEIKEIEENLELYCLNQAEAASHALKIIDSSNIVSNDPSLIAVKETDVYRSVHNLHALLEEKKLMIYDQ